MSKVYIVRDMPKFNFKPAAAWGEVKFILPGATIFKYEDTPMLTSIIYEVLDEAEDGDYFVMTSPNPMLFAISFAIYDRVMDGKLNLLRYDKYTKQYIAVPLDLNLSEVLPPKEM